MKVRYRVEKEIRDTVLDYSESSFSSDELFKQLALRLHDNQSISFLYVEDFDLYEVGANVLRQSILGHKSLRSLTLQNMRVCSYPITTDDEYYFPKDLDKAVASLAAVLRDGRLKTIQIENIDFFDRTVRHFEHFDMVDPAVMRGILQEEKEPAYIREIAYSLMHNPHLYKIKLTAKNLDLSQTEKLIEEDIRFRHKSEHINAYLQGTHASAETGFLPSVFKFVTAWSWMKSKFTK